MTEAEQIMKRCQAGTRNYEEANNLHAACYGIIGKLLAQPERDYERGFIDGMQKQMQSSVDKAVNRMAQPEQELTNIERHETNIQKFLGAPQQPEQEPVAWRYRGNLHEFDPSDWAEDEVTPLYTAPPQRPWVGLEGEEIRNLWEEATKPDRSTMTIVTSFARAIEAKLKEKNT